MEIKYATKALIDLDDHAAFIQNDSPRSALRFLDSVEKTGEWLLSFPEFGAVFESAEPELQGLRLCLVHDFEKYLLFYRKLGSVLRIERILHGSRDLPKILMGRL